MLRELHQFFTSKCIVESSNVWVWVSFVGLCALLPFLLFDLLRWHWLRRKLGRYELKLTRVHLFAWVLRLIMLFLLLPGSIFFAVDFIKIAKTDGLFCVFDRTLNLVAFWTMFVHWASGGIRLEIREAGIASSSTSFSVVKWEEIDSFSWTGKNDTVLTLKLENTTKTFWVPHDRKPEIDSLLADRGLDRADPP